MYKFSIKNLCHKNDINIENVYEVAVGANATMMHLLLGIDTITIGKSPYATIFFQKRKIYGRKVLELKYHHLEDYTVYQGVSSFIGADIVAGAVVAGLKHTKDNVFFLLILEQMEK